MGRFLSLVIQLRHRYCTLWFAHFKRLMMTNFRKWQTAEKQ